MFPTFTLLLLAIEQGHFLKFFVFISVVFPELLCPIATSIPKVMYVTRDISQNNGTKLAYLTGVFWG